MPRARTTIDITNINLTGSIIFICKPKEDLNYHTALMTYWVNKKKRNARLNHGALKQPTSLLRMATTLG